MRKSAVCVFGGRIKMLTLGRGGARERHVFLENCGPTTTNRFLSFSHLYTSSSVLPIYVERRDDRCPGFSSAYLLQSILQGFEITIERTMKVWGKSWAKRRGSSVKIFDTSNTFGRINEIQK